MKLLKKAIAIVCAVSMAAGIIAYTPQQEAQAAAKIKLAKKQYQVKVGKTVTIKVKKANKKTKLTWKTNKPKIVRITKKKNGKKAYAKVKGLKAGKAKVTATYKLGKKSRKLKCTVKVKKDNGTKPANTQAPIPGNNTPAPTPVPTPIPDPFTIVDNQKANAMMYIDANDSEYDGISIIAEAFKADIARVCGIGVDEKGVANESSDGLQVVTDKNSLSGKAIIAGTVGDGGCDLINQLVAEGKLDVSDVSGKWECYKLKVVKNPVAGVDEALVIAGSDKRGTIYGIFRISELMGVSPWVWWADAAPAVRQRIDLNGADVNVTSKEPSVKYRGIFLNDEAPSLTTWTSSNGGGKFGGRNQYFYAHVFELILRLKGDYLWPAMWSDQFSKGGADGDTLANAKLADQYGVVMGTSHHEPLYRSGPEWGSEYGKYKGSISENAGDAWNKYNIPGENGYNEKINTAIENFWADGVERNKDFDNICTVGMRGENDSSLPAADNPPKYAELLNYIIGQQKNILNDKGDTNPTQLVIYKEVERAWNEGALYDQDCMRDTIAMFADDNFSYLRTLPTVEQQSKVGGLGMYYHFDYNGGPTSYSWIQTTQVSRIWDQMTLAYNYGIDDVWIVNVGDLKYMELDISYFLDLGYDYDKWGKGGNDRFDEYMKNWTAQQFAGASGSGLNDEQIAEASQLISDYLDLDALIRVEHLRYENAESTDRMFSISNYSEAQDILIKCNDIMQRAEALKAEIPEELQAAYYELVYYPAMAVPNIVKIEVYAALNHKYADKNLTAANTYKQRCEEALEFDRELDNIINNDIPGVKDKWKGMQSGGQQSRIGVGTTKDHWQMDSGQIPSLASVNAQSGSQLNVLVENITGSMNDVYTSGSASLPAFTNINKEAYTIELANTGTDSYDYTATADADWIKLSKTSGKVNTLENIEVSVDWSKVTANVSGTVTISAGGSTVTVNVSAQVVDTSGLADKTYVMANGYAAINVGNYTAITSGNGYANTGELTDNKMIYVPDNGRYMGSIRTSSNVITYTDAGELTGCNAPYVEYKVYVPQAGTYNIQCQFNPTSNVEYGEDNRKLRYGISVDGGDIEITNSIKNDYIAGEYSGSWAGDIIKNGRSSEVQGVNLSAGTHTIRYYQCDPNMALTRITVYEGTLAKVYSSPAESYYVGKSVNTDARIADKNTMYSNIGN